MTQTTIPMPITAQPLTARRAFVRGLRDGGPFILIVGPFGIVYGVVAAGAGFSVAQAVGFSMAANAGAAQLTAIQLLGDEAPLVVVILTALAVNLRMAMYSASLAPYLGHASLGWRGLLGYLMVDQAYATAILQYERAPDMPLPAKIGYYLGAVALIWPVWIGCSLAGALLGNAIPPSIPIGFAIPIAFLALVGPMLRSLAHIGAAFVSVTGALLLGGLPYSLGLLVAALLAMVTGAVVETLTTHRRRSAA
jgi:predicted branched-subunit amino acid permease